MAANLLSLGVPVLDAFLEAKRGISFPSLQAPQPKGFSDGKYLQVSKELKLH